MITNKTIPKPKIGKFAIVGFAIFLLLYFISYFHRVSVPGTIFNQLQSDFSATATQISLLGTIFLMIYAVMQCFAGLLVDKLGAMRIVMIGAIIMSLGAFGFAMSKTITYLFLFRGLIAVGTSIIYLSIVKEISEIFSEKNFAVFVGLLIIVGYAGGLTATYPFERAAMNFGWRKVLVFVSVFSAILVPLFFVFSRKSGKGIQNKMSISVSDLTGIIKNILTFPIYATNSITFSIYFLIQSSIGKKMLEDCFEFTSAKAASYTFILGLSSMFGAGLSGIFSKLISNRRKPLIVIGASFSIIFLALMFMSINQVVGTSVILPAYILLGLSTVSLPLCIACTKELNVQKVSGTALGMLNAVCYAMVAILVGGGGMMLDLFKQEAVVTDKSMLYPPRAYVAVLTMCVIMSGFSLLSSFFIKETKGVNIIELS